MAEPVPTEDIDAPPARSAVGSGTGYLNPCPTCGVRPFQQCRSVSKGRKTDTHASRLRGEWPHQEEGFDLQAAIAAEWEVMAVRVWPSPNSDSDLPS